MVFASIKKNNFYGVRPRKMTTKGMKVWDRHEWRFRFREYGKQFGTPHGVCIPKSRIS